MTNSKRQRRRRPMSEINVVPYIDVMLVLLVIFVITAPLLTQGVKVNLPSAQTKAISTKSETPIIVTVNKAGKYFLNSASNPQMPLLPEQLLTRISAELSVAKEEHKEKHVLVKGDKDAHYGNIVRVMALLQNAGVDKVGLMTQSFVQDVSHRRT